MYVVILVIMLFVNFNKSSSLYISISFVLICHPSLTDRYIYYLCVSYSIIHASISPPYVYIMQCVVCKLDMISMHISNCQIVLDIYLLSIGSISQATSICFLFTLCQCQVRDGPR